MKASAFDYVRADTLDHAIELLARHGAGAKLIAGGQSLLPALNLRLSAPEILIDIGRIDALRGVALRDGVLHVGALSSHADLLASPDVARHAPLVAAALPHVAHPAIRSRGTIGGSLANADPAAELPACALAMQARMVLQSPRGRRVVAAAEFFTGLFETALAEDEILVEVEIDAISPAMQWGFQELARRSGDYAIVGLAAQGAPGDLRLAYFSVGVRATLAPHAAAALAGGITPATLQAASAALALDLAPHGDLQASPETRLHLAGVLLRRVLGAWAAPVRRAA